MSGSVVALSYALTTGKKGAILMATVENISVARVLQVMNTLKLQHRVDDDGDVVAVLTADSECQYNVGCVLSLDGDKKSVLAIRMIGTRDIPENDHGKAVLACNRWNTARRWPTASLKESTPARIVGEQHIDLQFGIHGELLSDWIGTVVAAGWAMFKELSSQGL